MALGGTAAHGQTPPPADTAATAAAPEGPALKLRNSLQLQDKLPFEALHELPTFLRGDAMQGQTDLETRIEGHAEMRRLNAVIHADRLEYYMPDDRARASGSVRLNHRGDVYEGPLLELQVDAFEGFFTTPTYSFLKNDTYGTADRVDFLDSDRSVVHNGSYTSCHRLPGPSWLPDWVLKAATLELNEDADVGVAKNATLTFKGWTTPSLPEASFPLSDARKSGLLPPMFGLDSQSGIQYSQPYYWDIAPNRDATITPTLMTKRGIDLDTEFRYLEPSYRGVVQLSGMPDDELRGQSRWGGVWTHAGLHDTGIPGVGPVAVNLNLNRASDDNFWQDFPGAPAPLQQRLLPGDAAVAWNRDSFTAVLREQRWQTLQEVTSPIIPPYDRLPELNLRYDKPNFYKGFDVVLEQDSTKFWADSGLTGQPNAKRVYGLAQISRPLQTPGWFVTPKLQLHSAAYEFDQPLANGATAAHVTVPTFSLDSGLTLERETEFFGRKFTQTLEPRAFYVYTPYRDQSQLPLYDTGATDFNFATIYTENAYIGHDRISDNNLLTLGLTSRLLDPDTGAEALRLGFAQRLRFRDQNVTLSTTEPLNVIPPNTYRLDQELFGATVNLTPKWTVDTTVQFDPNTHLSDRASVGTRYSPGNYRTVSFNYSFQRTVSDQFEVAWQWPLNNLWGDLGLDLGPGRGQGPGRWYSVGLLNYSWFNKSMVNALVGFEYDAGCWIGRIALSSLQTTGSTVAATTTTASTPHTSISFQIEFVGFSRVSALGNPLRMMKMNIPRYQNLRDPTQGPSPFSNYD